MRGVKVTFYGVRGSTPCSSPDLCGYGGNTSCVVVESEGDNPIVLDLGTGLRNYGLTREGAEPFEGTMLLTHLHWDHVQGLPFFGPLHHPDAKVTIYGPPEPESSFAEVLGEFMAPPYFPVCCGDLQSDVRLKDAWNETFAAGTATITARSVPHTGLTNGYRIDVGGVSIAYISDHQEPVDNPTFVDPAVLELAQGVDLLIHDAQYTPEQFAARATWGHCTMRYALEVAKQANAATLALFHHDPEHTDVRLDALVAETQAIAADMGLREVIAAREGESIKLV